MTFGGLMCDFCGTPKAIGACPHVLRRNNQVVMSERAYDELQDELIRLRLLEEQLERR